MSLLPRSLLRSPLAQARPLPRALLAAFAPPLPPPRPSLPCSPARALHVFAKLAGEKDDFAQVFVADGSSAGGLKKAIVTELKLDVAPNRVRLLLEVEGGAPVPLDSRKALAGQGVLEGCSVEVEVLPLPLHALSGFVSRAPDAALDAGLLAALAAPDTPDAQRLEALSALVADHCARFPARPGEGPSPALPIFHTSAHAALLRVLVSHARTLAAGLYNGTNGAHCRTLVGARGIGKSALMRAFALVAPSAFPSLLPVYLTGHGILQPQHVLQAGHLQSAVAAAAAQQNVPFVALSNLPTGRRLLLLVDEFDDLYRVPASAPALVQNVLATLGMLGALGDRTDGNCSVLLCGSSSSTYDLVQGKSDRLGREFPLAAGGIPDLNCTKFDRLRLPAPLCNATLEVEAMAAAMAGGRSGGVLGDAHLSSAARLLTFFLGAYPRAVARIAVPQAVKGLTGSLLASASPAIPPDSDFQHPCTGAFLSALLLRLGEENKELRALTRKFDGSANFVAIMDPACPWELAVAPLTWQQVETAFQEAMAASAPAHHALLMTMLDEITDKHLLRVHYPSFQEAAVRVWPATAAQAVAGGSTRDIDFAGAAVAIGKAFKGLAEMT